MIVADLHVHTTATDGRATARQVIELAAAAGLRYLVITDHSTVVYEGLHDLAAQRGISLPFPGMEISTHLAGRRYHLVAYGAAVLQPDFLAFVQRPIAWKNRIAERVHAALVRCGYAMPDLDEIRLHSLGSGPPTPEKTYVSRSALAAHLAIVASVSFDDAYEQVKGIHSCVASEDSGSAKSICRRYLPTLDVLDETSRLGIVTTVAHPLWRCGDESDVDQVCSDLVTLKERGLDGLETSSYHHRHYDNHPKIIAARDRLGLLQSGGSDYHANGKTEIGRGGLGRDAFEKLSELVEKRSARGEPG